MAGGVDACVLHGSALADGEWFSGNSYIVYTTVYIEMCILLLPG